MRYGEHTISIGTDVPSSAIRLKSLSINRACLTVFALMISGIFQNSAIRSISDGDSLASPELAEGGAYETGFKVAELGQPGRLPDNAGIFG